MLVKQLVKKTFYESLWWHNLWNIIWIIGLTISDQLQNVSFSNIGSDYVKMGSARFVGLGLGKLGIFNVIL